LICYVLTSYKYVLFLEYNPLEAPKLNEKVLKDKRKKLRETFQRVVRLYVSKAFCNMHYFDVFSSKISEKSRKSITTKLLYYKFN